MSVPDELADAENIVVYVIEEDGTLSDPIECTVENGVMTFKAPHFSTYIFAEDTSGTTIVSESVTTSVNTGDISKIMLFTTILCAATLVVVVLTCKNRYIRKA